MKPHTIIIGAVLGGSLLISGTAFYIYTDAQEQAAKRAAEAKAQAEATAESERMASMYRAAPVSARPVPWALRGRFSQRNVAEEQLDELRRANDIAEQAASDRRFESLMKPIELPAYKPIEFPPRPDFDSELQRQALENAATALEGIRRDQFYDRMYRP